MDGLTAALAALLGCGIAAMLGVALFTAGRMLGASRSRAVVGSAGVIVTVVALAWVLPDGLITLIVMVLLALLVASIVLAETS